MSNNKVKEFFDGRRRKARLNLYTHLKTSGEENRFKLAISIPLLNQSLVAMPKAISEVFSIMGKDDSDLNRASLNIFYEGMTIEVFNADKGGTPVLSCTGSTFKKLQLVATGVGENKEIDLEMFAYVPASQQVHDWVYPQLHGDFFLESVYSQSEMDFGGEDGEEDEEEEQPVGVVAAAAPRTKSGPKELAEYHAGVH